MKKLLYFAVAMCFGLTIVSCSDSKKQSAEGAEAATEAVSEGSEEAEEAVKAYEEYFVKYDALQKRSEAGEDVFDELMKLQEDVWPISEALLKTESQRNADQRARVKDIDEKIEAWKQKILNE